MRMGVCQALRQALQSGEPVVEPLCAEINMIRDPINALVDLPKCWELEARTVEK
jgi:hypothetical protein